MLDTDDLALWYALNRLITNYWADVDHNGGSRAHEFYLPAAVRRWPQPIRRSGEDPGLLCSAAAARQYHHTSPGRQSSGIPG